MEKKLQLILTKGLPASGKSTWAKAWVEESPKERVRVNRDDIRHMLGPYNVRSREKLIFELERSMVNRSLLSGYSVVIDGTNFTTKVETLSQLLPVEVIVKDFTDVPLETCIERDRKRGLGMVGEKVIRDMYNKYLCKETPNSHTG